MNKYILVFLIAVSCFSSFSQSKLSKVKVDKSELKLENKNTSKYIDDLFKKHTSATMQAFELGDNFITSNTIDIELPDGTFLIFPMKHTSENEQGYTSWYGEKWSGDNKHLEYVSLIAKNGLCRGSIHTKKDTYIIEPLYDGLHIIHKELEEDKKHDGCGTLPEFDNNAPIPAKKEILENARTANSSCSGIKVYNVFIAYSQTMLQEKFQYNMGNLFIYLHDVIESVNETYINSGIPLRARLAAAYNAGYDAGTNFDRNFDRFVTPNDGHYDEIFTINGALEVQTNVFVLLINEGDGITAGRAHVNNKMVMYQHKGADRRNYGIAHEIGHVLNLEHNREEYNWFQRLYYDGKKAYGKLGTNNRTVMAYEATKGEQPKVAYYSGTPNVTFPNGESMTDQWSKNVDYLTANAEDIIYSAVTPSLSTTKTVNYNYPLGMYHVAIAKERVALAPGFKVGLGSNVIVTTRSCLHHEPYFNARFSQNRTFVQNSEVELKEDAVVIAPNPVQDKLNIGCASSTAIVGLSISTMDGKEVYASNDNNIIYKELDLSELNSGIYVLKVETKERTYVQRIFKN